MKASKVTIISIALLFTGQVWALTFMGPAASSIRKGELGVGFDYSQANTDIRIKAPSLLLRGIDFDTYLARLIFGLADGAEISGRIGIADIEGAGSSESAWGAGVKMTFATSEDQDWGVLFQATGHAGDEATYDGYSAADYEVYEFQVAIGPTFKMGQLSIYGGPLGHFITGDINTLAWGPTPVTLSLEEETVFGGYGGLIWHIDDQASLTVEYQGTGNANAVGISLMYRFGRPSPPRVQVEPPAPSS